jgi:subtilisin-like proprotein convertase family protein
LATVPVDIVVRLHLDHPRPEDLLVVLEDPNEQQGTVLDHVPYSGGDVVTFVGSGDDIVNGLWTLHVTDTVAGESGTLLGWSVYLLSQWD